MYYSSPGGRFVKRHNVHIAALDYFQAGGKTRDWYVLWFFIFIFVKNNKEIFASLLSILTLKAPTYLRGDTEPNEAYKIIKNNFYNESYTKI